MGDAESYQYGNQIKEFLQGYFKNASFDMVQGIFSPPLTRVEIDTSKLSTEKLLSINVGSNI